MTNECLVSEPERDHGSIDAVLQKLHRCRVAQQMWCGLLVLQGWAVLVGSGGVPGHESLDGVATEVVATQTGAGCPARLG